MPSYTGTKAEVIAIDEWSGGLSDAMTELKWHAGLTVPQFQHRYYTDAASINTLDHKVIPDEVFAKINAEMTKEAARWAEEQ